MSGVRRGPQPIGCVFGLLVLLSAGAAQAWPVRTGLELQGGLGLAGTDLGVGTSVLGSGEGGEWLGRLGASFASRAPGGAEWRTGLAFQQWVIRDALDITYTVQSGPAIETRMVTFEVTQTIQELTLPIEVRLRASDASPWFLDLGPEVNVLLSARQRSEGGTPGPSGSAVRRAPSPSASQADIFEDVGTFGGTRDVTSRFAAASASVVAGIGFEWGRAHRMQTSLRLQQALFDQERASRAVVRPTRLLLGWGVTF